MQQYFPGGPLGPQNQENKIYKDNIQTNKQSTVQSLYYVVSYTCITHLHVLYKVLG